MVEIQTRGAKVKSSDRVSTEEELEVSSSSV